MNVIETIKRHHKVELVDDERDIGNGVIVTLKKGWTFSARQDNRVAGEDAATQALRAVRNAKPFPGPYED